MPNPERFIKDIQDKIPDLDFEDKRLATDVLNVTVWIDGKGVEIIGTIDSDVVGMLITQSDTPS